MKILSLLFTTILFATPFSMSAMEKNNKPNTNSKNASTIVIQLEQKNEIQKNVFELVLLEDDQQAGSVLFSIDGNIGCIDWIGVDDQFLGKGYGRLLLQNACKKLHHLGCETVSLVVMFAESSIPAVNLYRSEGFKGDPNDKMVLDLKQWWSRNNK